MLYEEALYTSKHLHGAISSMPPPARSAAPTPAPHRIQVVSLSLHDCPSSTKTHTTRARLVSRSGEASAAPPVSASIASHRKGVLTPPLFLNPLTPQAPPPMALSALSAKPCAASAPSSKVRAPAQTGSGASKTPPDRIQRDTWRCETSRQPPHGGVTRAADHLLHARTAHARGSTRCYWARDPASVPRTRTVRIVFPVVD
jgi:hypothetical protein